MKVQTLFKKALAVLIAVMMLASVTVPTFAADSVVYTDVATVNEFNTAIAAGQNVRLTKSLTFETAFTVVKDVIIDLNSRSLTLLVGGNYVKNDADVTIKNGSIYVDGCVAKGDCIIGIGNYSENATLTLDDVSVFGNNYSSAFAVFYVYNTSTFNLNGCEVELKKDVASAGGFIKAEQGKDGIVNITDSTIALEDAKIGFLDGTVTLKGSTLTIKGGANAINQSALTVIDSTITVDGADGRALTLSRGDVVVKNSTLNFSNCSEGEIRFKKSFALTLDENSSLNECSTYVDSTAYGATINGVAVNGTESIKSTVSIVDGEVDLDNPFCASVISGSNTAYYASLQEAIDAANAGETIELLADITLDAGLTVAADDEIILDLNGKTITASTDSNTSAFYLINNKGSLTVNDSVGGGSIELITAVVDPSYGYATDTILNNGTLVVNGGTIKNNLSGASYAIDNNSGATATINGGKIINTNGTAIRAYSWSATAGSTVVVNDGTVIGNYAIRLSNLSTSVASKISVTINGGTINGTNDWALYSYCHDGSNVNIELNGGEFNGYVAFGGGNKAADESIAILGGTYNGTTDDSVWTYGSATGFIFGGVFSSDVSNLIADGLTLVPLSDGTYGVYGADKYDVNGDRYIDIRDTVRLKKIASGKFDQNGDITGDAICTADDIAAVRKYTLDIKADATTPGGINATGMTIVRTAGKSGVKDRPIIRFYNGIFNASYIVYHSGSNGTNCPQFQFHGGEFNGTVYTNRALNTFYGGNFTGSMMMSVDSSAYTLISGGTFKNLSNLYMSALNSSKFTIGSAKGVYDKEVYVDDNGNFVIAKAEPSQGIEAAVAKTPGTNDYLAYSKVATEGALNYTDVYTALEKNKTATVTVYADEVDLTNSSFKGTIVLPENSTVEIKNAPADLKVTNTAGKVLTPNANGEYTTVLPPVDVEGIDVVVTDKGNDSYDVTLGDGATWNEGTSVTMTFPAVDGAVENDSAYVVHEHEDGRYIYIGKVDENGKVVVTNNIGFSTFTVNAGGLTDAIAAAQAGDTIILLEDISLDAGITVPADKTITLDLNGKTISQTKAQTAGYQMILNDGNLTIKDSGNGGKISYTDSGLGGEYISDTIYNRGTLVIDGGTIENLSSATVASNGYPHAVDTYSGIRDTSVTVNGGTIYCAEYSAIRMFCVSATYKADLVINGGTIKGAIDMQNGTKNKALGSLTINDGTFEITKNANNIRFANWNGGATEYGITASVTGGSFNGGITTKYVPAAANWNSKIISGGTFASAVPYEYCADGFIPEENSDGTYGVKSGTYVAKIDDDYYETLAEAVKAVPAGAGETTITLLADQSISGQFIGHSYAQKIILDLNGKTLSSKDKALTCYRSGTVLTIKNGTVSGNSTGGTIQVTYGGKLILGEGAVIQAGGQATVIKVDNGSVELAAGADGKVKLSGGKNKIVAATDDSVKFEACVNDYAYSTFTDAIAAANDGDTIKLVKNFTVGNNDTVNIADNDARKVMFRFDKNATLDLNGKTITVNYDSEDLLYAVVFVADGATLTVNNSKDSGGINVNTGTTRAKVGNNEYDCVCYVFWNSGNTGGLVINGGKYCANTLEDSMVYTNISEKVIINGGSFMLDAIGTRENGHPWIFNAQGRNERNIVVNGGSFNADVFHQYWIFEVDHPKEKALKYENGMYTVVNAVAYIHEGYYSGKTYYKDVGYASLQDAIDYYYGGDCRVYYKNVPKDIEIVLLKDIKLTAPVEVSKTNIILDIGNYNITMEASTPVSMITNKKELTIKGNGKISFTYTGTPANNVAANTISNRGKLTIYDVEISNTGNGNQIGYAIDNYNGATLVVEGGKITASGSSYYDGIRLFCGNTETMVTVKSGTISSIWAQNPSANKATPVKGTVVIDGGTVNVIYYENYTTVKVLEGVNANVAAYGAGSNNATSTNADGYTVYSFAK